MKYVDEFRNKNIAKRIAGDIAKHLRGTYRIMEVCGTHTQTIARYGLRHLLPPGIMLLSGPGCPICVSPVRFIDKAVAYASQHDCIVATFGDMLKVPGSRSSLEQERTKGADVRVVYSSLDALELAGRNPQKTVVFLGIGFETTAPTTAACIIEARRRGVNNFYVLSGHKVMPPALRALVKDKEIGVDAFILPAHVSTIIGSRPYEFIAATFGIDCVIAGFEPLDVLQGIHSLVMARACGRRPRVDIQYMRVVKKQGNRKAATVMHKVFMHRDAEWRGLGLIPKSGLAIRKTYRDLDIESHRQVSTGRQHEHSQCICGAVLKGIKVPTECKLFGKQCRPETPVGACMVSDEGTCAAYYKYGGGTYTIPRLKGHKDTRTQGHKDTRTQGHKDTRTQGHK